MATAKKKSPTKSAGVSPAKAKARAKTLAGLVKKLEALDAAARQDGQAVTALNKARTLLLDGITLMAAGKSG